MPANLAAAVESESATAGASGGAERREPVPTLEHFQNYLSHMAAENAANKARKEEGGGISLLSLSDFSFPHSLSRPLLGLPVLL